MINPRPMDTNIHDEQPVLHDTLNAAKLFIFQKEAENKVLANHTS